MDLFLLQRGGDQKLTAVRPAAEAMLVVNPMRTSLHYVEAKLAAIG